MPIDLLPMPLHLELRLGASQVTISVAELDSLLRSSPAVALASMQQEPAIVRRDSTVLSQATLNSLPPIFRAGQGAVQVKLRVGGMRIGSGVVKRIGSGVVKRIGSGVVKRIGSGVVVVTIAHAIAHGGDYRTWHMLSHMAHAITHSTCYGTWHICYGTWHMLLQYFLCSLFHMLLCSSFRPHYPTCSQRNVSLVLLHQHLSCLAACRDMRTDS